MLGACSAVQAYAWWMRGGFWKVESSHPMISYTLPLSVRQAWNISPSGDWIWKEMGDVFRVEIWKPWSSNMLKESRLQERPGIYLTSGISTVPPSRWGMTVLMPLTGAFVPSAVSSSVFDLVGLSVAKTFRLLVMWNEAQVWKSQRESVVVVRALAARAPAAIESSTVGWDVMRLAMSFAGDEFLFCRLVIFCLFLGRRWGLSTQQLSIVWPSLSHLVQWRSFNIYVSGSFRLLVVAGFATGLGVFETWTLVCSGCELRHQLVDIQVLDGSLSGGIELVKFALLLMKAAWCFPGRG